MLELRYYQRASLDALYAYWSEGGGNGLIVLPTGAGKALVIAKLIEELLRDYPSMRIINVTHSARLVGQNFKEFIGLNPFAPAGIYSAGLNRRDAHAQVLFAGIQSVANKADELGAFDLIIVDEAHAISRNADTQYGKFFAAMKALDPDCRVCGTTATDYRMDSGRLTEGDDRLFDDVVYEIGIGELIENGYLTPLTSQKTVSKIDLKGVATRGGDYVPGQLGAAAERIIEDAVAEDMAMSAGRRAGLFFCASKENSEHIAAAVTRHGRPCASLTSDNAHEAEQIYRDFESGKLWGIASVGMITTGANFPWVDFISLILSTKSPGKLVQILGRGTRNCDGKTDCLIADHGKNLSWHGPIDQIKPREPGSGTGEMPQKLCPDDRADVEGKFGCGELLRISSMVCQCCGYIFPPSEEEKITATADIAPVLSTEKPWYPVTGRTFAFHPPKVEGNPPSVKVTYEVEAKKFNEWLCPQHLEHPVEKSRAFPKGKADRYWSMHAGRRPFPKTVDEWLDRVEAGELAWTAEIQLDFAKSSKYPEVKGYRIGPSPVVAPAANDNAPAPANDNKKGNLSGIMPRRVDDGSAERARLAALALEMDGIPF